MRKLVLSAAIFAFGIALNMGTFQVSEAAGPFGNQGHWVETPDGGKVCATHWWANKCLVNPGDEIEL